jgi:hypothetical protein
LLLFVSATVAAGLAQPTERRWLAGDSHIHSHWSPGYDRRSSPPEPLKGQDALYPTPLNALMARKHGLTWMVTTDHGGPNHAKFNATRAYAELLDSRKQVPDLLQFYGIELNMPAMDHHTLIIPHADDEWLTLFDIERRFDANEKWPHDPERHTQVAALAAIEHLRTLERLPVLFANHPSRSARGIGEYGLDEPREFRALNDSGSEVYLGMEGAPGHQAAALAPDGSQKRDAAGRPTGARGAYGNPGAPTLGGFDQMTAIVGGLWDALLGEGRRFWIVATSDSHANYAEAATPGSDFWPGQFHKSYVLARPTYDDVLDGLRAGRIFTVAGDLITELDLVASWANRSAEAGGTLRTWIGEPVTISVRFRDPATTNHRGENPGVQRVDLIVGDIRGPAADRNADRNDTTRVAARFDATSWERTGDVISVKMTLPRITQSIYVRLRGTSSSSLEPALDEPGEDPWSDLWFYSNPVFITAEPRPTAGHHRWFDVRD